nr:hypothetical protein [Tanacetum cinerariifolium]
VGDKSGDDATIKGRRSNEGEAAAERISTDSKEIARVLTSLDATNVLAGETNVPTGSERVIGDKSGDDALIKGRRSNEGEAAAERISTDSEEIAKVLTSLDATNVLAGETNVPT